MKQLLVPTFLLALAVSLPGQTGGIAYNISTVAGSSTAGVGDGFGAAGAVMIEPRAVAVDSAGNIYIADFQMNRVRKIDAATGTITTVAGTGKPFNGAAASNGQGPAITVYNPTSLAYDKVNNALYMTAKTGHLVKRLDLKTGQLTTFAGQGASAGTAGFSGDGHAAISARLRLPGGVAVDSKGNVYIADTRNNRIRKVYVAVDPKDPKYLSIVTVAGSGPDNANGGFGGDGGRATSATLNNPEGVALDASDNIYIADTLNNRIRKVDVNCTGCADTKGIISSIAGTCVTGIADYSGKPVVCTTGTPAGSAIVAALPNLGVGTNPHPAINGPLVDGTDPTVATLNSPRSLAFDSAGNLYVADALTKYATPPPGSAAA